MTIIEYPETNPEELKDYTSGQLLKTIYSLLLGGKSKQLSMIDLCCDNASITGLLNFREKTFVDIRPDAPSRRLPNFVCTDVLGEHEIFNKKYDAAFCLDGIEHLSKKDGLRLLERMKKIASKNIIFTPLGDMDVREGNDPLLHHSGWLPEEFNNYIVINFPKFHPRLNAGAFIAFQDWTNPANVESIAEKLSTLDIGHYIIQEI